MIDMQTYQTLHPRDARMDDLDAETMGRDQPPDDQFPFLMPSHIKGFNLRRKKWFELAADRITDVTWNRETF